MSKIFKYGFFATILLVYVSAQGQTDYRELPAYKSYYDSLKTMDYKYPLPLLGKKAYQRGFDPQYAWGASLIYFTQTQEISISSIGLGLNGGPKTDFSDYIGFGPTIVTSHALTFRPDVWILPFLNIYGVIGGGTTQTDVTLLEPVSFETTQNFNATSFGLGATLAGSIGPLLIIWDNNYNFVDVDAIVEPVPAFNSSVRLGHNFMDPVRADRMLTVWVGTFYQQINNDTEGSIAISDIFPSVGTGENIQRMRDWADELPLAQQIVAEQIIDRIEEFGENNDVENASIDYNLQKEVTAPFNLLLGAQYQINKHWMFRAELGVFGKRSQFLVNLNYRLRGLIPRKS